MLGLFIYCLGYVNVFPVVHTIMSRRTTRYTLYTPIIQNTRSKLLQLPPILNHT